MRCGIAAQLVRDQPARRLALSLQQLVKETRGGPAVASRLHEDIDDVAVLVHDPPEIPTAALNIYEQLVQILGVAQSPASAPQPPRVVEPKRLTPLPNRLVGDHDPSLGQQILGIAEAETKAVCRARQRG